MGFEKGNTINLGRKPSEETRKKMSKSHKGLRPSDWGAGFKKGNIPWNFRKAVSRKAYFAGLVDGEGHIGIYGNAPDKERYQRLSVRISMSTRIAIDEAREVWGGYIYQRKRKDMATYWEWVLQHHHAGRFLRDIQPFVREKKEQVEIALRLRFLQTRRRMGTNQILKEDLEERRELERRLKKLHLNKGKKISS